MVHVQKSGTKDVRRKDLLISIPVRHVLAAVGSGVCPTTLWAVQSGDHDALGVEGQRTSFTQAMWLLWFQVAAVVSRLNEEMSGSGQT